MRKQALSFLLVVSVGLLSWGSAQGTRTEPFDLKKSQQELQIMKGILSTTLGFVSTELRSREASTGQKETTLGRIYEGSWGGSGISAYYLYGQGVTFLIPISSLRMAFSRGRPLIARVGDLDRLHYEVNTDLADQLERANDEMEAAALAVEEQRENMGILAAEAAERAAEAFRYQVESIKAPAKTKAARGGVAGGVPGGVAGGVPGGVVGGVPGGIGAGVGAGVGQAVAAPQAAPVPPAPAATAKAPRTPQSQEEMRKRLAEAQERVKKRREEFEAQRQKLLQSLAEVKVYLIEALANHGDSLTTVKPGEYINIILTTDEGMPLFSDEAGTRATRQVISVQKSWITDYKAGRLTMEAFKQKALQYTT